MQQISNDDTVAPGGDASLGRAAAHGSLWLAATNVVSKGSQGLVALALAFFLSPSEFGVIAVSTAILNFAQILASNGVYDVISRTKQPPQRFIGTVALLSLCTSVVLVVIIFFSAGWIANSVAVDVEPLIRVMSLALPFMAYGTVQLAVLQRELEFRRRLLPDAGSAAMGACVTISMAALDAGAWSVVAGLLVTACSQPLLAAAVGVRVGLAWDRAAALETFRWVRLLLPAAVLGIIVLNMDYIVIARVLGDVATGFYSLAFRIIYMPHIIVTFALGGVAFPIYSRIMRVRPDADISVAFGQFLHANIVIVGGLYLLLALNAERIVLISSRWSPSGPVLSILCIYGFLLTLLHTCYVALRANGRLRAYIAAETVHVLALGSVLVVLTPLWGIRGAAVAQVLSISLVLPGVVIVLVRVGAVASVHIAQAVYRPMLCLLVTGIIGLALNDLAVLDDPYSPSSAVLAFIGVTSIYSLSLVTLNKTGIGAAMMPFRRPSTGETGGT